MNFLDFPDDDPERKARRPLLIFVIVALAVGAAGSAITEPSIPTWFAGLNRPTFTPPDWVFAPVWTTLYVLMAVAAGRVWQVKGTGSIEIKLWAIQLGLNLGWSLLFFGLKRIDLALIEILVLWLILVAATTLFFRADRWGGILMLPYLLWVAFAGILTHGFWVLNG